MAKMMDKLKAYFDEADTDKTGTLNRMELCKVVQKGGSNQSVEEISGWFDEIDVNNDDAMTFDELSNAINKRDPDDVTEADLRSSFREFDTDGSGTIDVNELKREMQEQGLEGHVDKILEIVDTNDDGKVNFEEFLVAWRQNK